MAMTFKKLSDKSPVGVIGSGSFGTAIANLLAENGQVLLYARKQETIDNISIKKEHLGQAIHENIFATSDIELLCKECYIIFPSVPSDNFRAMIRDFSPYLRPDHILIHTTKGFDIQLPEGKSILDSDLSISPKDIITMSKVIMQESMVKRIGCLSGPNLSREIANKQPAATVIASHFDEVIKEGEYAIRGKRFQTYGNHDIFGIELAGVLKNTMAIAAGALGGLGYGQNAMSFLIARGLSEIIRIGTALGAKPTAFLGVAGIGDLIATCTSPLSRNYTVGYRLAKGESLKQILDTSTEVAEGIKTINISKKLCDKLDIRAPIIQTTYKALFEDLKVNDAVKYLMDYRWGTDVDFM
jgi:glycerol-3-phosphate dehydrogenase (NAD(P)+)